MQNSTFQRDDLMPKTSDGTGRGFALATLVHIGLIIAITFGVSWRVSEPEGVEAELWASVPQVAAQRAVEPEPQRPPPPKPEPKPEPKVEPPPKVNTPDPQIAIEKAKQEKLKEKQKQDEQDKLEQKKLQEKQKADAEKLKKEEQRKTEQLEAQREANIKRILGEAGATGNAPGGKAATNAGPSASWVGRVIAQVRPNFIYTDSISGDPTVEIELKLAPNGNILSRKLVKSSGDSRLDEALLRAIDKTETLPRDTDGTVPPYGTIAFRPGKF